MFKRMQSMRMQAVHCFQTVGPDQHEYRAIVAIHNTHLGPALGGCRCLHYSHEQHAFDDAMRLAQGMSYKAALANMSQGGGKSVILLPKHVELADIDRNFLFTWFGRCVDSLQGQYITAMDVGTQVSDMDIISRQTRHVASASNIGDPAESTAQGVMAGIRAALKFHYFHHMKGSGIKGKTFAIQGLGHVGGRIAKQLLMLGGHVIAADPNEELCQQGQALGMSIVNIDSILTQPCDVLVPCALGGIINDDNVMKLNCEIVAGSANNQLAKNAIAERLRLREILYAPDYIINAGGLIFAAMRYAERTDKRILNKNVEQNIEQKIEGIFDTLTEVFQQAESEKLNVNEVANSLAIKRLTTDHANDQVDVSQNKGAVYYAA